MNAPCFNCDERKIGCHSTCERYKEWCIKNEQIKEKNRLQSKLNAHYWLSLENYAREKGARNHDSYIKNAKKYRFSGRNHK